MGTKTHMDEQTFNTIKLMLKGGATPEQIRVFKPISRETLRRVVRTESYTEYRELQEKYANSSAKNILQRNEANQEPASKALSDNYQMNRIYEALKRQNEILELLTNKVSFIVDELTK